MKIKQKPLLLMMIINFILLFAMITGSAGYVLAAKASDQPFNITGTVTDDAGQTLPGVTVTVRGTLTGTVTNMDGRYELTVPGPDATIVFSFIGMQTREIPLEGRTILNITLSRMVTDLDEVVVVGYGTQRRGNLTGSIATVDAEDLVKAPSFTSVSNAIRGQVPGLISVQSSGQPGFDQADIRIRGFGAAMVVVDGVEADLHSLDPSQIESVTVLKDGAASIYGSRAGNGVILITTKRGNVQKPTFRYASSFTQQGVTYMPRMASSGMITEMRREAHLQAGRPESTAPFTADEVRKFHEATDPQYPNTDWESLVLNKWAPQQQHNLSVRGGSEQIKYYGYLGYNNQQSMWKSGNGGSYDRFNFQSNIDAKILDNLHLRMDVAATWEDTRNTNRGQNTGTGGLWQDFWATEPMWPGSLPDPTKHAFAGPPGVGSVLLSSNTDIIGYSNNWDNTLKGTIALDYDFKGIQGLSANAFVNVLQVNGHFKHFMRPYDFYFYDFNSDIYTLAGGYGNNALNEGISENRIITGQAYIKYENLFAEAHRISAIAITEIVDYSTHFFNAQRTSFLSSDIDYLFAGSTDGMSNSGAANEMGRSSYIGRVNYAFKDRYLFESIFRADASAKFPEETRWGFFPSVSVGWVLSSEPFMQNFSSLDWMKLRASYGESGRDAVGNFQYLAGYQLNSRSYILGTGPQAGILSTGLPNPNLTWEQITIYNTGVDFSFFNRSVYGEVDVFYRLREGIPATRITSLPSTFGSNLPPENLNSISNRGFELMMGTAGRSGDFVWDVNANISWSRAKWEYYEEPEYDDPDQERIFKRTGQWTDRIFGYRTDGLFTSQDEVNNLPFDQDQQGNVTLKPGDIKFIDINGDGVLDWKDQVEIGNGGTLPNWNTGLSANLRYRGFDMSVLFQGGFGNFHRVNLDRMANPPVQFYNQRWTEENNDPNAFFPRLGGSNLNNSGSDHWWLKAGYLRLKVANLGYTLPSQWMNRLSIDNMRIYLAGTNLFTVNPLKDYGIDPEITSNGAGFYYPQQRTVTIGLELSF